jgi:ATP-dependent Zn protease
MKRRSKASERSTAFHEAGHAVAAVVLQKGFSYATIVPDKDKDTLGHVNYHRVGLSMDEFRRQEFGIEQTINKRKVEREVMISLAGDIAERCVNGGRFHPGSTQDYHTAFDYADVLTFGNTPESEALVHRLFKVTEQLVKDHWTAVTQVAEELIELKTVKAARIRAIVTGCQSSSAD